MPAQPDGSRSEGPGWFRSGQPPLRAIVKLASFFRGLLFYLAAGITPTGRELGGDLAGVLDGGKDKDLWQDTASGQR